MTLLTTRSAWNDAGILRERLAEIHTNEFISLSQLRTEREIVRTLVRLTGMSAEEIRQTAEDDAYCIACEADR